MPTEWQGTAAREKAALFKVHAHEVALAAREEAGSALFNAYAHGVALAAREEAASALFNADAHGVAGHGSPWEGCIV